MADEEEDYSDLGDKDEEFMTPEDAAQYRDIVLGLRARYCAERGIAPEDLTDEQVEEIVALGRGPVEAAGFGEKYCDDFIRIGLRARAERLIEMLGPDGALDYIEEWGEANKWRKLTH